MPRTGNTDSHRAPVIQPFGRPLADIIQNQGDFFYIMRGDIRLRVFMLESGQDDPRGTVIIHPGRTEFIEKYLESVEDFHRRGFSVLVLDPRGQGLSSRELADPLKCYVKNFQDYSDDLAFVIDSLKKRLPKPHILFGHSMGGCTVLHSILLGATNPSIVVCSAPMLGLFDVQTPMAEWFVKICTFIGFSKHNLPFQKQEAGLPVPFKGNKLTSDKTRFLRWAEYFESTPKLRVAGPTFAWVKEALRAMAYVNRNAKRIKVPGLIIAAGGDPIVDPSAIEQFSKQAGLEFKTVAGALHEVLMEKDEYRDQFFTYFDAFLKNQAI